MYLFFLAMYELVLEKSKQNVGFCMCECKESAEESVCASLDENMWERQSLV